MNRTHILFAFFLILLLASGCAPTTSRTGDAAKREALSTENLRQGINELAEKLVTSTQGRPAGKIAVADFVGPGSEVYVLGEHISDKVSVSLFSSGAFSDFMERKQLKQVLLGLKGEHSGYFDQSTVQQFGKMIGVDSMVIGTIEDLGTVVDVTAKIVQVGTGRLLGMADIQLPKDSAVKSMLYKQRTATLTINIDPPVGGTVVAGGKQSYLTSGMVTFTGIPYGECQVLIQPEGYEAIHRNIDIRSNSETLGVRLESKRYEVRFQINPPDASLTVDGKKISLNPQGFANISDLEARKYTYVVGAKRHKNRLGTFNPANRQQVLINLETADPFLATGNKFFQKVQQFANRQDFSVQLWTDRATYRVGEPIHFYFRAERDCYLNLVDINSEGEISLLFPNRFDSNNSVQGGKTYRIPEDNYGFALEAMPPTGTDRIYAIASTHPLDVFDHDFARDAFVTMTRGTTRGIDVKGIGVRLDRAKLNAAAMSVVNIRR